MENQTTIPTAKVILWPWSKNKDKKHPVKLCVYFGNERKYFPVVHNEKKLFLSRSEWEAIEGKEDENGNLIVVKSRG